MCRVVNFTEGNIFGRHFTENHNLESGIIICKNTIMCKKKL